MIAARWRYRLAGLGCAGWIAAASAAAFQAQFSWQGVPACTHQPPAFGLRDVPPGTTALRFSMQDLQAPNYPHGGGMVRYTGSSAIPAGAFAYNGPCPPPGAHHTYRWTVQALSSGGRVLAQTAVEHQFPP